MNKTLLSLALTASLLSGCSSMFEVGEEPTVCPITLDPGIPCTSTREALELTDSPDGISREKARRMALHSNEDHDHKHQEAKVDAEGELVMQAPPAYDYQQMSRAYENTQDLNRMLPAPEPIAVRKQPKMLRVAFAPWQDNFGRLQNVGYVYSEIEERKYTYGREAFNMPAQITPLSIRQVSLEDERRMNQQSQNGLGIQTRSPTAADKAAQMSGTDRAPAFTKETFNQIRNN
ncbi:TraV family lipoprotein [Shewanella sp. SG44-6]|jgi:conjugal transfer pilus assembly protein TraV|uniref:TraV family lipoprotein n=1 Tax=Shewanella sp. SG44-6 TaxID=2760959 RepID=UPI0015FFF032|nr:TraV family lipoprotein [Shewanella sp. SG44-6]MBB1389473.1 TraV family lipoprotein [Shewanella sp. SG44-6]